MAYLVVLPVLALVAHRLANSAPTGLQIRKPMRLRSKMTHRLTCGIQAMTLTKSLATCTAFRNTNLIWDRAPHWLAASSSTVKCPTISSGATSRTTVSRSVTLLVSSLSSSQLLARSRGPGTKVAHFPRPCLLL